MEKDVLQIDGSMGEGGGQVLRTSISLSLLTGREIHITGIRSGRKKSGLLRQHLTAVRAAIEIGNAKAVGAEIGSSELKFIPGRVMPGNYEFSVGSAGSAMLVLQTVLPALLTAEGRTALVLEGGTHNPFAPPFDFIEGSFIPCIEKMGPRVSCILERAGYYPAGGGRLSVIVEPSEKLMPIDILSRGEPVNKHACAVVCQLSPRIAKREVAVVEKMLNWPQNCIQTIESHGSNGPGNYMSVMLAYENVTGVFSGFGQKGVTAEGIAKAVVGEVREYLSADAPVCRHLADQLLLPMAMAGKGSFRTLSPTEHTLTNIEVIKKFLDIGITCENFEDKTWHIDIG